MLLWGAYAYLAALVPRDLAEAICRRLALARVAGIVAAMGATAAALPLDAAAIGDGWSDMVAPGTLQAVLFHTNVGHLWLVQAFAALALAATLLAPVGRRRKATALTSGFLLATLALNGHVASLEGLPGIAHKANNVVHVLAGGAWLGALVPLLPVLDALDEPKRRGDAAAALRSFSAVGHGAVAIVLATGTVNTVLILGRWPTDWSSPYQALLAAKIVLAAGMTALAIGNRYGAVPRLRTHPEQATQTIRIGTIVEIVLGVGAIAAVSVFGLLEPA